MCKVEIRFKKKKKELVGEQKSTDVICAPSFPKEADKVGASRSDSSSLLWLRRFP